MRNSGIQHVWFFLLFIVILAACSNDNPEIEKVELDDEEISDDMLMSVVETNVAQLLEKNFDGYMATIHKRSPVYDSTSELVEELFNYTLDIELSYLTVKEKSAKEAIVAYAQRTMELEGSDFQANETIGEHLLKPEDGVWKIYNSEVIEVNPIEIEEVEQLESVSEEVALEGTYADIFLNLENPFAENEWILVSYTEDEGEATAEYITTEEDLEDYTRMATLEFYENGNELSGLAHFISVFEQNLFDLATGDLAFDRLLETESEVVYEFTLTDDDTQEDQQEIGRVFIIDNDIYIARYTVINETIEDDEEIIETLREIQ